MPTESATPIRTTAPPPGVDHLRCWSSGTGYRNVYRHESNAGGVWYVAKVKYGGRLRVLAGSRSRSPRATAAAVVAWYRRRYGDRWPDALRWRKFNARKVWYSRKRGGFLAAVWLWGDRCEVRRLTRGGDVRPGAPPVVFQTRAEAVAACRAFAADRWGLFGPAALWRA
ncbi:unnamed protein product [Gemmataceae bacterium]|nr:unnamed protein product [Gemmataceae bacterium]VTT99008.1 unnamed protein product [Gemmataceae bacterium]